MTKPKVLVATILLVLSATALPKPMDVRLEISDDGRCMLQGKPVARSDLRVRLLELKAANPDVQLHVSGSPGASYAQIAPVMKLVEEAGLVGLRFVLEPPDASASAARASSAVHR